jgi:RNA polymerase sigma-70 factor (ECF subfamily)
MSTMPHPTEPDYEQQLVAQRSYLMRFARLQLRNDAWAEDAVSETLLAALSKPQAFEARSQLKTWLVGILKHKIMDLLRKRAREPQLNVADGEDENELVDALFKENGHWADPPQTWNAPEQSLENAHFWNVFEQCNQRMPLNTARAFMMREFMEMSTEDICQELAISTTNCWVILHRARLALRECLDINWFGNAK